MEWASDMVAGWRVKGMIWSDWSGGVRCLGIEILGRGYGLMGYMVIENLAFICFCHTRLISNVQRGVMKMCQAMTKP